MINIRGPHGLLLAAILACAILATPLWCVTAPAMPDYPAHLASFYLIGGGASHFYQIHWGFLPNLAGEVLVPLMARAMPLDFAVRLFLTLTVCLWVLGPVAIQRALFGKPGIGALLAAAFTYNDNFQWGFLNYSFAAGASFFVFAAWIATAGRRTALHLLGFALAFTLVYFSHLFALATLLLLIGCFELSAFWPQKTIGGRELAARAARLALICLPAAFCFLLLKPAGGGFTITFDLFGSMRDRLESPIQFHFDRTAYLLLAVVALAFVAGLASRRLKIAPQMRLPLIVLAVAMLLAPEWALGGWGVHLRLPAVLAAIAFASSQIELPRRWLAACTAAILAMLALQALVLATEWRRIDARYSEYRRAAGQIRTNARLLTVLDGDSLGWSTDQYYWHIAEFSVIDRGAFTPLLFTTKGQHVVQVLPPMDRYAATTAMQGSPPDIDELNDLAAGRKDADEDIRDVLPYLLFFQCRFDQAVVILGDGRHSAIPPMLHLRYTGSFFAIYDIAPDARCAHR